MVGLESVYASAFETAWWSLSAGEAVSAAAIWNETIGTGARIKETGLLVVNGRSRTVRTITTVESPSFDLEKISALALSRKYDVPAIDYGPGGYRGHQGGYGYGMDFGAGFGDFGGYGGYGGFGGDFGGLGGYGSPGSGPFSGAFKGDGPMGKAGEVMSGWGDFGRDLQGFGRGVNVGMGVIGVSPGAGPFAPEVAAEGGAIAVVGGVITAVGVAIEAIDDAAKDPPPKEAPPAPAPAPEEPPNEPSKGRPPEDAHRPADDGGRRPGNKYSQPLGLANLPTEKRSGGG